MSYKRVRTLGDLQRFGLMLLIVCAKCGRERIVTPRQLMRRFPASELYQDIGARLVCRGRDMEGGGCGERGAIVRLYDPPNPPPDPEPDPGDGGNVLPLPMPKPVVTRDIGRMPARRRARQRRRA